MALVWRKVALILAIATSASFAVGLIDPGAATAAEPGTACDTNSEDTSTGVNVRCIDGLNLTSRQNYVKSECITSPTKGADLTPDPEDVPGIEVDKYTPGACGARGRGAEAIAEARYLNRTGGGAWGSTGLEPPLQYEVNVPNATPYKRADILQYNPTESIPSEIEVLEVKGTWSPSAANGFEGANNQAQSYVEGLNKTFQQFYGKQPAVLSDSALGWYTDEFRIKVAKCNQSDTQSRYEYYNVSAPSPGLLEVDRTFQACQNNNQQRPANEEDGDQLSDSDIEYIDAHATVSGGVSGDPHMTTVDGLRYDLQSEGEFILAESSQSGFTVQVRLAPVGPRWSAVDRVSALVGTHRVELRKSGDVLVDGTPVTLANDELYALPDGGYVLRNAAEEPDRYLVVWPGGADRPILSFQPSTLSALVGLEYQQQGGLSGLLGNANGNPLDDLALRDGTALGSNPGLAVIHGSFADSWRISDGESLFTYSAGESTETFTDPTFPDYIYTIDDVDPSVRDLAVQACDAAGVVAGPQFDDCVLDMALTNNNEFADMASQSTQPLIGVGDLRADAGGDAHVDFEGAETPPNFNSGQLAVDSAIGKLEGPFSGTSSYRFYLPDLPAHIGGTVSFDLLAFGDWSDSATEDIQLRLDDTPAWSQGFDGSAGSPAPLATGTTDSGTPFTKYRFTVPFQHVGTQISGLITATNVDGLAHKSFGIDNIDFHVDVVPPQVFDLGTLTATSMSVSNGVPGAGAGNLETLASQDQYTFTVSAGQSVFYDYVSGMFPGKIVNDATGAVVTNLLTADQMISNLAAGTYRIVIAPDYGMQGTYAFKVFVAPDPQVFNLGALTTTPVSVSNGVPDAGAGNLETLASQDQYTFTVTAGQSVFYDYVSGGFPATLINDGTGATVVSNMSTDQTISNLAAGTYRLIMAPNYGAQGIYSFRVFVVPDPQVFDLGTLTTTQVSVSNGVPAAGAGNIETQPSKDIYTFTLASAASVYLNAPNNGCVYNQRGTLTNVDTGVDVASNFICNNTMFANLSAGHYKLTFSDPAGYYGTYSFKLFVAPDPQVFNLGALSTTPVSVSNGVPSAGAGNLETLASQDQYTFTVSAGQSVFYDYISGGFNGKIINDSTGATVANLTSADQTISSLAAGTYRLIMSPNYGAQGTYSFQLKIT